jgi:hypothetical protein
LPSLSHLRIFAMRPAMGQLYAPSVIEEAGGRVPPASLGLRRPYEQGAPISKNVRDTSGRDAVTSLVVSVRTTSVYEAQAKTNV